MPEKVFGALNPTGRLVWNMGDQLAAQQQERSARDAAMVRATQDAANLLRMQQEHDMRMRGDFNANAGLQRDLVGTFADRSAAEQALARLKGQGQLDIVDRMARGELDVENVRQGGMTERTGLEQGGMTDRTRIQGDTAIGVAKLNPALALAELEREKYGNVSAAERMKAEAEARRLAAEAAAQEARSKFQAGLLGGGAEAPQIDPETMAALQRAEMGKAVGTELPDADALREKKARRAAAEELKGKVSEDPQAVADVQRLLAEGKTEAEAYAEAAKNRSASLESGFTDKESALRGRVKGFMGRDAALTGSDPTEGEVDAIAQELQQVASSLSRYAGEDRAKELLANLVRSLFSETFGEGDVNDLGADMSRMLAQRLGINL